MSKNKDEKITMQGMETPVSVGSGARTGSTRSKSSDCPENSNSGRRPGQGASNVTGIIDLSKEEDSSSRSKTDQLDEAGKGKSMSERIDAYENPRKDEQVFKPRSSLSRTPPGGRGRVNSMPSMSEKYQTEADTNTTKRKRMDFYEPVESKFEVVMAKLVASTANLQSIVNASYRPSGELKNITFDIRKQVDTLTKEIRVPEENTQTILQLEREKKELWEKLRETEQRYKEEIRALKEKINTGRDAATQTNPWHRPKIEALEKLPDGEITFEKYKELEKMRWKEELSSNVKTIAGNPLNTEDAVKKVVLVGNRDPGMSKSIQKIYKERYPELEHLTEDIDYLETFTRDRRNKTLSKKTIIKLTHEESQEDLWAKMKQLFREGGTEKETFAIHKLDWITIESLEKMMQCLTNGTEKEVHVYVPPGFKENSENRDKGRNTYALMVQCKDGEYRETLKNVRNAFRNVPASKSIRGIRSTKEGKMIITMDKCEEDCKVLTEVMNKIEGHPKHNLLRTNKKKETLHIRGMDAETSREEVMEALKKILGDKQEIAVGELRPNANDTQAVTVKIEEGSYSKIGEIKRLRIGLANCQITKRVDLRQCTRCWSYEHLTSKCKDTDRRNACFKCGQEGHPAKTCENKPHCVLCNEDDHSVGSGRCKFFREALAIEKRNQRMNEVYDDEPETEMKETDDICSEIESKDETQTPKNEAFEKMLQ